MNFVCQEQPLAELDSLRLSDRHSILIEGPSGCGKTFLAMKYAEMRNISDFQVIAPKVDDIKSAIQACTCMDTEVVLCIENLDLGALAASYVLLKFLEEPMSHVFIIVTCQNINSVPDTIISRSAVVSVPPPIDKDIITYALSADSGKYTMIQPSTLWRCVRTFREVDTVFAMSLEQLTYFEDLKNITNFRDSVSNIIWKLSHYPDNSEAPIELVIRYLMLLLPTPHIQRSGVACLNDLATKRIAAHAILARFAFEVVYCE